MQLFPDSGWLRAFDLKIGTLVAVAVASWISFALAELGLFHVDALPVLVRTLLAVVGVFATALWLARMINFCHGHWREWKQRRAVLARLSDLGSAEVEILAECLQRNEQSFRLFPDNPTATSLRHKGLATLPFLSEGILNHCHVIPDFVWRELQRRSKAIMNKATDLERIKAQRCAPTQDTGGW